MRVGDLVRVPKHYHFRGGHEGFILDITSDGLVIEFQKDCYGDPRGLPTIEMWQINELEIITRDSSI